MTIIAALDAGDHLLLASDSMMTEATGIRITRQKLDILPNLPFAWGFSGDAGIGNQFRDWLMSWTWPADATWRGVADAAIEELSRLNGRKRNLNELAGVDTTDDDLATVLMAGYVGGVPDIFELTNRGAAASVKNAVLAAIGSGETHARVAYHTLKIASPALERNQDLLRFVVGITAGMAPMCGMPIRMLRIDQEHVEEVSLE
jgi:hypothetical protein